MAGLESPSVPQFFSAPLSDGGLGNASDEMSAMTLTDQAQQSVILPDTTSAIIQMFQDGAVVILQSVASRHTLCVTGGEITGKGIRDAFSQFRVHTLPSGRVALQNVGSPDHWLTIYEGKTLGSGSGGPYAELVLHEIEDKYVALESGFYPGQHVGVREDGEIQPPAETPPMDRASLFVPFPHFYSPSPAPWVEPSPQPGELPPPYPGPPQDSFAGEIVGPAAPPAALPPLPPYQPMAQPLEPFSSQQPVSAMPSFPEQSAGSATAHPPGYQIPSHPAIPLGYEIMDLFHKFNSLHLIPREESHLTDHPVAVSQGFLEKTSKLKTGGHFHSPAAELLAETSPEGNIALRNPASQTVLCCNKDMKLFMGDDVAAYGPEHLFTVRSIHGAIVALESVKFSGHFVSVSGKSDILILERAELKSHCIQFTVYVSRFKGPYSRVLTSPFSSGRPSLVSKLRDLSVIQLFSRQDHMFLSIGRKVQSAEGEEDGTFLLFRDRGMGRVSLSTYFGRKHLKIDHNGHLSTDTHGKDKYTDFCVRECPDGTLLFESIVFPQEVVHMTIGKKKEQKTVTQFSVYLLDREKTQGPVGSKTIPKYLL